MPAGRHGDPFVIDPSLTGQRGQRPAADQAHGRRRPRQTASDRAGPAVPDGVGRPSVDRCQQQRRRLQRRRSHQDQWHAVARPRARPAVGTATCSHWRSGSQGPRGSQFCGQQAAHRPELTIGEHGEPPCAGHCGQPPVELLVERRPAQPDALRLLANLDLGNLPKAADGRRIAPVERDGPGAQRAGGSRVAGAAHAAFSNWFHNSPSLRLQKSPLLRILHPRAAGSQQPETVLQVALFGGRDRALGQPIGDPLQVVRQAFGIGGVAALRSRVTPPSSDRARLADRVLHDRGQHFLLLLGVPNVSQHPQVRRAHLQSPAEQGAGRHQPLELHGAAVGNRDAGIPQAVDQFEVGRPGRGQLDPAQHGVQAADVFDGKGGRRLAAFQVEFPPGDQHVVQPFRRDVVAPHPQQEPVEQGPQRLVLRQPVAGADRHQQGERPGFAAAAKHPLVEHHQEAVQDRAVGVEQLVEEHQRRLGQHALGIREQFSLAELADVERPEQLVGLGEPRQQIVEHPPVDPPRQVLHEGRLGGARRTEDEQVFARDEADAQQVDDLVLGDERALHGREHGFGQPPAQFGVIRRHGDGGRTIRHGTFSVK